MQITYFLAYTLTRFCWPRNRQLQLFINCLLVGRTCQNALCCYFVIFRLQRQENSRRRRQFPAIAATFPACGRRRLVSARAITRWPRTVWIISTLLATSARNDTDRCPTHSELSATCPRLAFTGPFCHRNRFVFVFVSDNGWQIATLDSNQMS